MTSTIDHQHQQQQQHSTGANSQRVEFVKSLSAFFKRDLISIPLIKKYPHQALIQRCQLKAATLELDTSAYPNIEYIAGNRLSIYPLNPVDHVNAIIKHTLDDLEPHQQQPVATRTRLATKTVTSSTIGQQQQQASNKRQKLSTSAKDDPLSIFVQLNGKDSLRLLLTYVYDITAAPSRILLRILAENCTNREQKGKLLAICKSDESWEKWVCSALRTLKSTFEEFSSCLVSAKSLLSELTTQQPRLYSISSIKSSKRFRAELIIFQHKFSAKQIASSIQNIKERETIQQQDQQQQQQQLQPLNNHVNYNDTGSQRSNKSIRSVRSVVTFGTSPITSQQVNTVPPFSGPLMSQYAIANSAISNNASSSRLTSPSRSQIANTTSAIGGAGGRSRSASRISSLLSKTQQQIDHNNNSEGSASSANQYEGLCSSYLLNLNANDCIICEFVENPRFTLKGNRERPIMMIGQDVGVVAFRPFWQQRSLEHDRAQVFYTMFKDLKAKKFGDMQLVCLTGSRCKVEDLFKREINAVITNKILSSASYINRASLSSLLDIAAASSNNSLSSGSHLKIESKELVELGQRIAKLLLENNGCLYTCCDPQMTQAIEILVVESVSRLSNMTRDRVMDLLLKWKGRKMTDQPLINNKFLFTLENPFERAQIVQEIYDYSL